MIALLGFLARLSVVVGFIGLVFSSVSDLLFRTDYLATMDNAIDMNNTNVKVLVGLVALISLIIFFELVPVDKCKFFLPYKFSFR